jgi:hypothetical protein
VAAGNGCQEEIRWREDALRLGLFVFWRFRVSYEEIFTTETRSSRSSD